MVDSTRTRTVLTLVRNLTLAVFLYGAIFAVVEIARTGSIKSVTSFRPSRFRARPSTSSAVDPANGLRPFSGPNDAGRREVEITVGGIVTRVWIDPHANVFNRPQSLVVPKDGYLGLRPHVDTVANLPLLVERCRGSMEGLERMRNLSACLDYLAHGEAEYYSLPPSEQRASHQDPQKSEYALPASHEETLTSYPSPSSTQPASKHSTGTCAGPVIPFHVYWTGAATWRVEIFIKSYLYTQNLPCSRLWLWVDADRRLTAVEDMLERDPHFARFLPLVQRGDVIVRAWHFPSRIPLPADLDLDDLDGLSQAQRTTATPSSVADVPRNADGEKVITDGIIEDAQGQRWLTLTAKQMTFLPVAVSDAVRFVVLHLYGGVYLDMDVLLLRDMRPLLLPDPQTGQHAFAERWAAHQLPGDYNTAIMSFTANSSLSSYLLRGGIRMGLNFHPRVIGRMAWKDARNEELLMLESTAVDPVWPEFNGARVGRCTVPCFRNYGAAFKGTKRGVPTEWSGYDGATGSTRGVDSKLIKERDLTETGSSQSTHSWQRRRRLRGDDQNVHQSLGYNRVREDKEDDDDGSRAKVVKQGIMSLNSTHDADAARLRAAGVIQEYIMDRDKYPPNNRTLEHFFRGAWTYHIHNQVRQSSTFLLISPPSSFLRPTLHVSPPFSLSNLSLSCLFTFLSRPKIKLSRNPY